MRRPTFDTFRIVEAHRTRLLPEFTAKHQERLLNRFNRGAPALVGDVDNIPFREAQESIPPEMAGLVSEANLALDREGVERAAEILAPLEEDLRTALIDGWQELRNRKTRHARARSGDWIKMPNGEIYWMPAGLIKTACEAAAAEILNESGSTVTVDWLRRVWRSEFVKLMDGLNRD